MSQPGQGQLWGLYSAERGIQDTSNDGEGQNGGSRSLGSASPTDRAGGGRSDQRRGRIWKEGRPQLRTVAFPGEGTLGLGVKGH